MSQSNNYYDVVIVGGGPAGSTAGLLLAQAGLSVLIADKAVFPRDKVCGGFLTDKTLKLIERIHGKSSESLKDSGVVEFEASFYTLWFKKRKMATDRLEMPFTFVRRATFDTLLLNLAEKEGASVLGGNAVVACDPQRGSVTMATGQVIEARYVIGADGANSVVRRSYPENVYSEEKWKSKLATGLEVVLSRSELTMDTDHPNIYFGFVRHGYSWVFPRKNEITVGMGGLNCENRGAFARRFTEFLSSLGVPNLPRVRPRAHPIPYGNYLEVPAFGRSLLIGDAAGFADSLLGEGLFYAIRSAELVAQAIVGNGKPRTLAVERYVELQRKEIRPHLEYWDEKANILFSGMRIPVIGPLVARIIIGRKKKKLFARISQGPPAHRIYGEH